MAAGAAWRYPAFYSAPQFDEPEFTFSPPHTLYIDAALQIADDGEAELIEVGDRTNNDWILDTVTHQPLGRQAAIKGRGGVFYWDLNLPALRVGTSAHVEPNLRRGYELWIRGQAAAAGKTVEAWLADVADDRKAYKFLLGVTKRKNIDFWEKFTVRSGVERMSLWARSGPTLRARHPAASPSLALLLGARSRLLSLSSSLSL